MACLHELRELLIQGDYFLSFDDLLKVIRDVSIKYKFSFKTLCKCRNNVNSPIRTSAIGLL
jgi:hypothetical protein